MYANVGGMSKINTNGLKFKSVFPLNFDDDDDDDGFVQANHEQEEGCGGDGSPLDVPLLRCLHADA